MKHSVKQTSLKAVALGALLLMAILPMRAQWYIGLGGTAMVEKNPVVPEQFKVFPQTYPIDPSKSILVNLHPQVGYQWNEHWAVGAFFNVDTYWLLYKLSFKQWSNYFTCSFNPYLRYMVRLSERFSFQADAFLDFGFSNDDPQFTGWGIGLRPGLQYELSKHFRLQASVGFLGLYSREDNLSGGFDFTPKQWNLSLIYAFSKKDSGK